MKKKAGDRGQKNAVVDLRPRRKAESEVRICWSATSPSLTWTRPAGRKLGVKRALNAGAQVEVFGLGCKSQLYKMKSNPVRVKLSCGSLRHRNGAPAISGLFFKPLQGCMGAEKLGHRVESEHKRDATRKGKDGEKGKGKSKRPNPQTS